MKYEIVNVEIKCKCGHSFDSQVARYGFTDWGCPKCGKKLGMDRIARNRDENPREEAEDE